MLSLSSECDVVVCILLLCMYFVVGHHMSPIDMYIFFLYDSGTIFTFHFFTTRVFLLPCFGVFGPVCDEAAVEV